MSPTRRSCIIINKSASAQSRQTLSVFRKTEDAHHPSPRVKKAAMSCCEKSSGSLLAAALLAAACQPDTPPGLPFYGKRELMK